MLSLLAGVLLISIPCNVNWSMINNNTLALFKENGTSICVDFKDNRNTILKYRRCYDFNEIVIPQTVFEFNDTIYVVAKSVLDNATLIHINSFNKLKLFSYKPEMLRFNYHSKRLVDFNSNCLEEYDIESFLHAVINNLSMEQIRTTYIVQTIEDYQFYDNDTIYYLQDGEMFLDSKNQLYLTESECLQLLMKNESCKTDSVNPHSDLAIQLICLFGLIALILFVFTGPHLQRCWQRRSYKKPFIQRKEKIKHSVPQTIPIIRNQNKNEKNKEESELIVLNCDM